MVGLGVRGFRKSIQGTFLFGTESYGKLRCRAFPFAFGCAWSSCCGQGALASGSLSSAPGQADFSAHLGPGTTENMYNESMRMASESSVLENQYDHAHGLTILSCRARTRTNHAGARNPQFWKSNMTKPCAWFRNPRFQSA